MKTLIFLLQEEIAKDISVALGGPADKVQVTSLRAGSIIAEVVLYDGLHPHGLSPTDTFYALRTQLSMPDSPLKGLHTCIGTIVCVCKTSGLYSHYTQTRTHTNTNTHRLRMQNIWIIYTVHTHTHARTHTHTHMYAWIKFSQSRNNAQLGVTAKLMSTGGMHTKYALDFRILHRAYPNEAYKRAQDVHNPPSADDGFSRSRRGSVTARAISPVVGYLDGKLPADVDLLSAGIGLIVREDESGRKIVEQVIFFPPDIRFVT